MLRILKLSPALEGRLRFALLGPERLELSLSEEMALELCEALDLAIPKVKKRREQELLFDFLSSLHHGLIEQLGDEDDEDEFDEDEEYDEDDPEFAAGIEFMDKVRAVIESNEFQSEDDVRAALDRITQEYNNTAQPDRSGLTPAQAFDLMRYEWADPRCPLRFNTNLSVEALERCSWVHAALKLIGLIEGGVELSLTPKGQLNRASLRLVLEAEIFQEVNTREMLDDKSIKDEVDVHSLLMLRAVMEEAGLLERKKRKVIVTDEGRAALKAGPTGELLALLFGTLFDTLNLDYFDPLPEVEGFQDSLGYMFYALQTVAREPIGVIEAAGEAILLPNDEGIPDEAFAELMIVLFIGRVLAPLNGFGMVDMIVGEEELEVATRPLFHEFLSFEFGPAEA